MKTNFTFKNSVSGFSLVEIVLAMALFALVIFGLMSAVLFGERSQLTAGSHDRAALVAKDAISAVENIRDQDPAGLPLGTFHLVKFGSIWSLIDPSQNPYQDNSEFDSEGYKRSVVISDYLGIAKKVTATVAWNHGNPPTAHEVDAGSVSLVTYLLPWRTIGASTPDAMYEIYGLAGQGGGHDVGAFFGIDADGGNYTDIIDFTGNTGNGDYSGSYPHASLVQVGRKLYGTTYQGADDDRGTIFSIDTANNNAYTNIVTFPGIDCCGPFNSLTKSGTMLYGMIYRSDTGVHPDGFVYSIDTENGDAYTELFDFTGTTGAFLGGNPTGNLLGYGGYLYGATSTGGANDAGTVFSFDPNDPGGTYSVLYDFTEPSFTVGGGSASDDALIILDGVLYGVTSSGGVDGLGGVFSIDTNNGNLYTALLDFSGTSGDYPGGAPQGGKLTNIDGIFYGVTRSGGANDFGVVYKFDPADPLGTYAVLKDFDITDGRYPEGNLVRGGNLLYGTTVQGGDNSGGVIFTIDLDNSDSFTKIYSFTSGTGAFIQGSLLITSPISTAYWKLDETSDTVAVDSSLNGNDGTLSTDASGLTNAIVPVPPISFYDPGSMSFNGIDQYVSIPDSPSLGITSAGTVAGWIRLPAIPAPWGVVVAKRTSGNAGGFEYELDLGSSGDQIRGLISDGNSLDVISGDTTVASDEWHHVAFTWDGSNLNVYLDGVSDTTAVPQTINVVHNSNPIEIGRANDPSPLYFEGLLDDVRIYDRALTAFEVASLAAGNE